MVVMVVKNQNNHFWALFSCESLLSWKHCSPYILEGVGTTVHYGAIATTHCSTPAIADVVEIGLMVTERFLNIVVIISAKVTRA